MSAAELAAHWQAAWIDINALSAQAEAVWPDFRDTPPPEEQAAELGGEG